MQGWRNEEGDAFFKNQRQRADTADAATKAIFFQLMHSIGSEMDRATSAITITMPTKDRLYTPAILDLCMAPGGFSDFALGRNRTASLRGISLPPSKGGHDLLIPNWEADPRIQVSFCDITMLAVEMGTDLSAIPAGHPDATAFSSDRPFQGQEFDLIFCDGQVLRTHERHSYRKTCEASRLISSQLVLALQRIRDGGTLIILLHKADSWKSILLMHTFASFADIQLFKPCTAHRTRSSFYLVAQKVRPGCIAALDAIAAWKEQWTTATFGMQAEGDAEALANPPKDKVAAVLSEFGTKLVQLGQPVFAIQAEALRRAPYVRGNEARRPTRALWR